MKRDLSDKSTEELEKQRLEWLSMYNEYTKRLALAVLVVGVPKRISSTTYSCVSKGNAEFYARKAMLNYDIQKNQWKEYLMLVVYVYSGGALNNVCTRHFYMDAGYQLDDRYTDDIVIPGTWLETAAEVIEEGEAALSKEDASVSAVEKNKLLQRLLHNIDI